MSSSSSSAQAAFSKFKGYDTFRQATALEDLPGDIQAIARSGMSLFVATSSNSAKNTTLLHHYRLPALTLLNTRKMERAKVSQLEVIGSVSQLLVLADGQLTSYTFDGSASASARSMSETRSTFAANGVKGAKMLAVDRRHAPPAARRLCVAVKKKLLLYRCEYDLETRRVQFQYLKELGALAEPPQALAWYGDQICVGYKRSYVLVSPSDNEVKPISLQIDSKTTPLACVLPGVPEAAGMGTDDKDDIFAGGADTVLGAEKKVSSSSPPSPSPPPPPELLLAGLERVGVLVNFEDGAPLPRSNVTWTQSPTAVCCSFPHFLSLVAGVGIEVRLLLASGGALPLVQRLKLPTVRSLCHDEAVALPVLERGISRASTSSQSAQSRSDGIVFVATATHVYSLQPIPLEQQLRDALDKGLVEAALALLDAPRILRGHSSSSTSFGDALNAVSPDVVRELRVKVGLALLGQPPMDVADALRNFALGDLDPRELLAYFSDDSQPETKRVTKSGFSYEPQVLQPGAFAHGIDGNSFESAVRRATVHELQGKQGDTSGEVAATILDDAAALRFREAQQQLLVFLRRSRTGPRYNNPDAAEAIDTAILKLLALLGPVAARSAATAPRTHAAGMTPAELDTFAEAPNQVDLFEAKEFLMHHRLYHVLALLYKGRGNGRQALELWARMGSGELTETGYDGVRPTVDFLAHHDDEELVWVFSYWVLLSHPDDGLRIFTGGYDKEKSGAGSSDLGVSHHTGMHKTPRLPPERVMKHLESFEREAAGKGVMLCKRYLRRLVLEQGAMDEELHTRFAMMCADDVIRLQKIAKEDDTASVSHELEAAHRQLSSFLEWPMAQYDAMKLLSQLKGTAMRRECVVLYSKLNCDREALRMLVYELDDAKGAEAYCLQHGIRNDTARAGMSDSIEVSGSRRGNENELLLLLLKTYLHPEDESKRELFLEKAVELIGRHALRVDAIQVLRMLPDDLPLSEISGYLQQVLPSIAHSRMQGQIMSSLERVHNLHLQCSKATLAQHMASHMSNIRTRKNDAREVNTFSFE